MKIGIFDPYLDDLGGGEKYMMTVASCLSKKHEVTVFWDRHQDLKELLQRFSIDLSKVSVSANIFSPKISFFQRAITTKGYDVIIVLSDGSIPFSLSKKLFIHFQQPITGINLDIKKRFKISRVTKIFCNAYYTKSYIDKEFGVNSLVLYPPVNLKPRNLKKENIILNVGRFRVRDLRIGGRAIGDYKKQSVMVNAFKKMVDEGLSDWMFIVCIGLQDEDKTEFEKLQKIAEDYPVKFLINLPNIKLWDIYSKAKIYWHASGYGEDLVKHPEYAEHFGISTVEAMGAGAVPVVINSGGQKEIVEDGKNGFLWETLEELRGKTMFLINNQSLWSKLSKEAKKRAQFFSGRRFCEELEKIIK